MSDKERQDDDDIEEKDDNKQQGQQSGNSGIHKYFGKSSKSVKFLNSKIKKSAKLQNYQNISLLVQTNLSSSKQLKSSHQKTKVKIQYKFNSQYLNAKPKLKLTLNPFLKTKPFQQVLLNWKSVIDKMNQQNFDFKVNNNLALNVKYKKTKWLIEKKLRNKLQLETTVESNMNMKGSVFFQTMLKSALFENYKYINSSQLKGKVGLKDFPYSFSPMQHSFKFDFSQKLTFLINQYKAKQQTKVNMTFGPKQTLQLKSNVQVTNPSNTWTIYSSVFGYKWGVGFDQMKFVYSLYDNWKVGCMYGQKNAWQFMIQNQKLNKPYCSSIAFHLGNKNYSLVLKNKFNKRQYGRVNVQLALQNGLRNTNIQKVNYGLMLNFNL